MKLAREGSGIVLLALALCVPAARGQQKDPRLNPPVAPLPPLPPGESSSKTPAEPAAGTPGPAAREPDQRPLSGVEQFTLGTLGGGKSYLLTGLRFSQSVDSNTTSGARATRDAVSTLHGNVALRRVWSNQQLSLSYSTGGILFNTQSRPHAFPHGFGITHSLSWRRWSLLLSDHLSYLPESSFGFGELGLGQLGVLGGIAGIGGIGGIGGLGLGFNPDNLNPLLIPNQTILTGASNRISNTVVGQVNYSLGRRSSLTASGAYGLLRFVDAGFTGNTRASFQVGYNYALSKANGVALSYGFARTLFGGTNRGLDQHNLYVTYGRRVTGRLALALSGGPNIRSVRNPLPQVASGTRVSWGFQSSLQYSFLRSAWQLTYSRHLSGGSGVFQGAHSDVFQLSTGRQLSPNWSGSLSFGYAHNSSLREVTGTSIEGVFNSWRGTFGVGRRVGRNSVVSVDYSLQRQTGNTNPCAGINCQTSGLRHAFGIRYNFNFRPIGLE